MKRLLIVVCVAISAVLVSGAMALAGDPHHAVGGEVHVYGVNPTGGQTNQILLTGAIAARGTTSNVSENVGMVTTPEGTFEVVRPVLLPGRGEGRVRISLLTP